MKRWIYWLFKSNVLLTIFVLLVGLIMVIAHKINSDRKEEIKASIQNNLKAIAELKSQEIHPWLNERLADAEVLSHLNFYPVLKVIPGKDSFSSSP
jgi:F0F1-type ATP synthase membrane subunit b/b'